MERFLKEHGDGELIGRKELHGQERLDRAMELLGPVVRGEVPMSKVHGELAAMVLQHEANQQRRLAGE